MLSYNLIKAILDKKLTEGAFRRGTSANRFGLVQQNISDHLPIKILVKKETENISLVSWNMLSDAHLYNNFMNITGTKHLLAAMNKDNIYGGTENNNKLYHYFSELSQFLYDNRLEKHSIVFDHVLLHKFTSLHHQQSLLARSRDPLVQKEKMEQVERSRAAIAAILLDREHDDRYEFEMAIQHSVDLIYHINMKMVH